MGKIALLPRENRQRSECARQQITTGEFLPRDSYTKRGIYRRRVSLCVSVCLWVCHTPVLYQNG